MSGRFKVELQHFNFECFQCHLDCLAGLDSDSKHQCGSIIDDSPVTSGWWRIEDEGLPKDVRLTKFPVCFTTRNPDRRIAIGSDGVCAIPEEKVAATAISTELTAVHFEGWEKCYCIRAV